MSEHDERETPPDEPATDESGASEAGRRERELSDPRDRPPDPAGTQPKHDPDALLPSRRELSRPLLPPDGSTAPLGSSFAIPPGAAPGPATAAAGAVVPASSGGAIAPPPPQSEHAPRFQFLLGALGAVAAAAAAIAVAIVASPSPGPAPAWSSWHPVNSNVDPAQQIADHVGPEYRLDNGHQIVQVQAGPQVIAGQPAELALRMSGSGPALLPGNGVIYGLCGTGTNCSIGEGKPSAERLLLLRREALELALYTFRYVNGVNQVVVIVPPRPPATAATATSTPATGATGSTSSTTGSGSASPSATTPSSPNHALLFRPGDVALELGRPLGFTLSSRTPTVSSVSNSQDAGLVDQLTKHNLYDASEVTDSQSNPVILLQTPGVAMLGG